MSFDTISDLYNSTLTDDNQYSQQVLTFAKAQIETLTAANTNYAFQIDIANFPFVDTNNNPITLELKQLYRITDIVIFNLRDIGINCSAPVYSYNYPDPTSDLIALLINVSWYIREKREFMKQYY